MRYFGYMAEQAFRTAPDGTRLFCRTGPWARGYVVPDEATERRLFRKQLWLYRLFFGGMIVGQPFLFQFVPNVVHRSVWFLGYMAAEIAVFTAVAHLLFRADLRTLQRSTTRIPVGAMYAERAGRHSVAMLVLGLLGSVLFVVCGVGMLLFEGNSIVGWMSVGFFGLCAVVWGHMLRTKLALDAGRRRRGFEVLPLSSDSA